MVDKVRKTAKEIQDELRGQGTSVSDRSTYHFLSDSRLKGNRPRRTALLKESINKLG